MKVLGATKSLICYVLNLRRKIGLLVPLMMYPELAHKLVTKGNWYMIRLSSGMQTPILNAIGYLRQIEDMGSISLLESLKERYAPRGRQDPVSFQFGQGTVTCIDGPFNYIPRQIYKETCEALEFLQEKRRNGNEKEKEHDLCRQWR